MGGERGLLLRASLQGRTGRVGLWARAGTVIACPTLDSGKHSSIYISFGIVIDCFWKLWFYLREREFWRCLSFSSRRVSGGRDVEISYIVR